MRKSFFSIVSLFFVLSCGNQEGVVGVMEAKIKVDYALSLLPDYEYNYANTSGYVKSELYGKEIITHLSNSNVYAFDLNSGELLQKINVNRDGPASIGSLSKFDGVVCIGEEKLLYSCHFENEIRVVYKDSATLVKQFSDSSNVRLVSSYQNPPVVGGKEYVFSIFSNPVSDLTSEFCFVAVSDDFKSVRHVVPFSSVYKEFFGGTPYLYWASITFNEKDGNYLVSYPVDHDMYLYDSNFKLLRKVPIYQKEVGEIRPYSLPLDQEGFPEWQSDREYYKKTNHFVSLRYVPSFDGYIRVARIYDEVEDRHNWLCIMYNKELTASKSFYLDSAYLVFNSFTSDDGVLFLNENRLVDERSISIPFDAFKLEQ